VAELHVAVLAAAADLKRQHRHQSPYPPVARDLNLVVDEQVRWSQIADTVRSSGGEFLEQIHFHEPYRDPDKDGAGKKRLLFSVTFRSPRRTLTGEEIDAQRQKIVAACSQQCGARLID
jgi:phenylalanyl-tRNA synthetase beta chain